MPGLDLQHLREWIGRTAEAEDLLTPRLVEGFRATLEPHLAPVGDGDAPWMIHWCLAPDAAPMAGLGADGHPARGGFLPPVPLPRRMWAGGRVEMLAPLRIGDRVVRRSTIADVDLKEGRSGLLCFVTLRHELSTGRGPAIRERQDLVYRAAPAGPAPAQKPAEPAGADRAWTLDATPTLLFRYSALTFNGHRIHYDRPYAVDAEFYPGLVVHGPLQATLLFNLAAMQAGRPPARFDYRGIAPLIAGQAVCIGVRTAGTALEGRVEDAAGVVTMTATAGW